jgi:hypothetical protein
VQGNLELQSGGQVTYNLSENPIQVQGSIQISSTAVIQVNLDDDRLTSLRGKEEQTTVVVPLIRSDREVSVDVNSIIYSHNLDSKSCNKVSASSLTVVKGSLAAVMTIDGSKCRGPSQWSKGTIIGVTVGIVSGIVAIVVVVALLATFHPKIRRIVRPFTARNEKVPDGRV